MAIDLASVSPEILELHLLQAAVYCGDPRQYIERYFKIQQEPEKGGLLVPMLLANEPNQEYYYEQLLPQMRGDIDNGILPWQVDVLCFKDRKARWSSLKLAILTAKFTVIPGTHVFGLVNAEDTFTTVHRFVDTYFKNTPLYARPEIRGSEWGVERKVLRFATNEGGEMTSTFTVRTASNPNVGSGETPTDVFFDEYAKFPKTFSKEAQSSIRASMAGASFWRGGTVGPDGADCAMYEEIQQIKRGERQTLYLFRTWFANPANHLKPGSRLRRPQDIRDEDIIPGFNGGPNCDKEAFLVTQFPDDGIPVAWRLAWRRAKMGDAFLAAGGPGNEDTAAILFQREHCEDDRTPWFIAGPMQFTQRLMEMQIAIATARENILVIDESIHGLQLRAWRGYDPTHVYIMGQDFGSGTQGDDTTGQILDATTMTFMAEYHGNVTEPYHACAGGKLVMGRFGNGVWVPETNRFPGIGNHIKKTLGYHNTFRPPRRDGEAPEAYWQRPYGMHVGATHHSEKEPSAEELLGRFKSMFNNGGFKVVNPHLLEAMQRWNPDQDKHTPDRIAGARLALLGLDMARDLQPVTGQVQVARPGIRIIQTAW